MVTLPDVQQLLSFEGSLAGTAAPAPGRQRPVHQHHDADARRLRRPWVASKPVLGMATYNASFAALPSDALIMKGIQPAKPSPPPSPFVKKAGPSPRLAPREQRHLDSRLGRCTWDTRPDLGRPA